MLILTFFPSSRVKIKLQPLNTSCLCSYILSIGVFIFYFEWFVFVFGGRGDEEMGLFSFKPLLLISWKSAYSGRNSSLHNLTKENTNQNQFGACFILNQTRAVTILNAVQNQALPFWPIKFYILFPSRELCFLIYHTFPWHLG